VIRLRAFTVLASIATLLFGSAASADEPSTQTVTISGDRADALRVVTAPGTVIGEKELRQAQPESSGEMLRRVPGLQVRQEDPMGLRLNLGVRGLSPTRSRLVLVEEDGVPVVVSPYGEPELYYTTAVERVQRLDVIKGSNVLAYGPQTVGAVIRLHTWDPTTKPGWYVSGSLGTRTYEELLARYSDTTHDIGYVIQAFQKSGDGYRKMPFHATDAFSKIHVPTGPAGELRVKIGFHDDDANTTYTGLTDRLYRENPRRDTIAPDDHFGVRRYELSLQHDQQIGLDTVVKTAVFAYQMSLGLRLQDFDRSPLPQVDYARIADSSGLFFRSTSSIRDREYYVVGSSIAVERRIQIGQVDQKVTAGVRTMYDSARRKLETGASPTSESGPLVTDDTTHITAVAAWVEDQIAPVNGFIVTPAFRVEHSRSMRTSHRILDTTGFSKDVDDTGHSSSTGLMPGIGVGVGGARLAGFSSAYLGYSAPRVSQAITPDGKDANLSAEHSANFDLGARTRVGKWLRAEAAGFYIHFDNQLVSNNPLRGFASEFVNGGQTQHVGVETTATARIGNALDWPLDVDLAGQYTFVRSRFDGGSFDGHAIPYSPSHTGQITLDVGHKIGISGQVAFQYVGAQFTDEQNSVVPGPTGLDGKINPYTVLDLGARYKHARTGLALGVTVKNALDNVYISDRLPNGIFTSGFRQMFATLSWSSPE
jgi:Fe(3+) dicitrate transport protein